MYFTGIDNYRNKNYETALEWFNQASERRYPKRMALLYHMAECYFNLKEYNEAKDNYETVANDLYSSEFKRPAAERLAQMYRSGLGVEKNSKEALHWQLEAASAE